MTQIMVRAETTIGAVAAGLLFFASNNVGVPSSSGPPGNVSVNQLQQNRSAGKAAAKKFFKDLRAQGINVVAEDGIYIETPLGDRIPDGIIEVNGDLIGIEVKSGSGSRTALQAAKDMYINLFGGKAHGANAANAGVVKIKRMITFFVP